MNPISSATDMPLGGKLHYESYNKCSRYAIRRKKSFIMIPFTRAIDMP